MRVLGAVVHVSALSNLVDEEPEESAENDALVEGLADHVNRLVVDAVKFLHADKVVLPGWRVGNGPETEILHVAEHSPAILEGDGEALVLQHLMLVLELAHANVGSVASGLLHALPSRLHERQLVIHLLFLLILF